MNAIQKDIAIKSEGVVVRMDRDFFIYRCGSLMFMPTFGPKISRKDKVRCFLRWAGFLKTVAVAERLERQSARPANPSRAVAIIREVAAMYGVPETALRMREARCRTIDPIRSIAIARVADETDLSFRQIGMVFGRRDPTTIRYALAYYNQQTGKSVRGIKPRGGDK